MQSAKIDVPETTNGRFGVLARLGSAWICHSRWPPTTVSQWPSSGCSTVSWPTRTCTTLVRCPESSPASMCSYACADAPPAISASQTLRTEISRASYTGTDLLHAGLSTVFRRGISEYGLTNWRPPARLVEADHAKRLPFSVSFWHDLAVCRD